MLSLLCVLLLGPALAGDETKVSEFGRYEGYTRERYDGWKRESFFIQARDGTRLACDLFRPTLRGAPASEKLPLLWTHHRYQRSTVDAGQVSTILDIYPHLVGLLRQGYLVAAVDVRGSGASFGVWRGLFTEVENEDAYDVTEWFARQDFCDGHIGMFGSSYLGGDQFMAASQAPPHLEAIFPWVAPYDVYDFVRPGGVPRLPFLEEWSQLTKTMDQSLATLPVDEDRDRKQLIAAHHEHAGNLSLLECLRGLEFRDSAWTPAGLTVPIRPYEAWNPASHLDEIAASHVAIYHMAGWFDVFVDGTPHYLARLSNPQKAVFGPWFHLEREGVNWAAEMRRWFDHWLKGIDNGIMREPAVHYFVLGAGEWRAAKAFPPPARTSSFYFAQGPCGSIDSANDGALAKEIPDAGLDAHRLRTDTTTGLVTRTGNAVAHGGFHVDPPVLTENDRRGLTYTSPVLDQALETTGYPIAHLWLQWDGANQDGDVFVYLEDVSPARRGGVESWQSTYVSEGCLRASHRALAEPIAGDLEVPQHENVAASALPVGDQPIELVVVLYPTSCRFAAGHRIRVTIESADRDNFETPAPRPGSGLRLLRGGAHASRIELPLISESR
jgi:putative CocE/NonD family hydrolase